MAGVLYTDLDLLIQATRSQYRAHILSAPAGQVAAEFALDVTLPEFQDLLSLINCTSDGAQADAAKRLGTALFSALFAGELGSCLRSSLELANTEALGLRIRLRFDAVPELSALPWEYLYDPALDRFLALSAKSPLVRFIELPERIRPVAVQSQLHILFFGASVAGLPALDTEREWELLREAAKDLERGGVIRLERLNSPSLGALQERLRRGTFHVFHFVGHGAVDPQTGEGTLIFANEAGRAQAATGTEVATFLHDHASLRLAVLNACETGQGPSVNAFAGVAPKFVQQGIPAVIAMQAPLSDRAAVIFAREFYGSIADGYPIDAAIAEARKAIFTLGGAEWGIPVLYMRASNGQVFAVRQQGKEGEEVAPEDLATAAADLIFPFLAQSHGAAEKASGVPGNSAKAVYLSVSGRLRGDPYAEQTLRRLEAKPQSGSRQAALVGVLEELIREDPTFAQDLQDLLSKDQADSRGVVHQEIKVSGQARTGNIVQIGKVEGNIDLDRLRRERRQS